MGHHLRFYLACLILLFIRNSDSQGFYGLSAGPISPIRNLGLQFRYASSAFIGFNANSPQWNITSGWSWSHYFRRFWPVRNQQRCSACWAFAAIATVEATFAITHGKINPPYISVQQLIDCLPQAGCNGGWPTDAFEYMSTHSTLANLSYPYKARPQSRKCPAHVVTNLHISMYEEIDFFGWLGLLLAVQQSPLVVFIDASSPQFLNYNSQSGVFSCETCFSNETNHAVALVGYSLVGSSPFWILRNSWGAQWGINGYMNMAISGGVGVCGINVYPALMPIIKKKSDPCNTVSYGSSIARFPPGSPGTVNPCGNGKCVAVGGLNQCTCSLPFVAATQSDGTQACVIGTPCSFFATNPCRTGTCVDGPAGQYTCLCPVGYSATLLIYSNAPTCVASKTRPSTYIVPSGFYIRCDLLYLTYSIPMATFLSKNPALKCGSGEGLVGPGTVNIKTTCVGCQVYYPINIGDSCASIASLFTVSTLSGPGSPNPDLNCSRLVPGQQVCIRVGMPPDEVLCMQPLSVSLKFLSVAKFVDSSSYDGDPASFYTINPGLYWTRIFVAVSFVTAAKETAYRVCINGTTLGTLKTGCGVHPIKKVSPGQNCFYILHKYFGGSAAKFSSINGKLCRDADLFVGYPYCVP